ncbi:universal stress protein YxiE-like [Physella acuta]|uniref:universal stress protein YxiE-like n=1 Tax=Physella acuta TaxID=109671 RepID=UPI0027DD4C35|nr:universal stress protein YxiE-like [Physella acuta]
MSSLEIPEITTSSASSSPTPEDHHHHHHHHHNLTRFTGKGAEATGKRVLIGVDGSEPSNFACDWYFQHLWTSEDYIVLLNCPDLHDTGRSQWNAGKYVFVDREVENVRVREGEEQLHHELEKFREKLLQHSAHGKVRAISAKSPEVAILRTAEEEKCDVIVIGCRGRSALRRTILGTVSDYIVHHSHVPVVVCRHKVSSRRSSSIVPPNPDELSSK